MKYVNPYLRKEAGVKDWWDNLSPEEKETLKRTGIGAGAGGVGGLALAALTGRKKKGLDALAHYAGFGLGGAGIGGLAGYGYDRYKKGKDRAAAEVAQLEEERRRLKEELDNARKKPEKKGPTNARERRHASQQAIRDRIAAIDAEIKKLSEQQANVNASGAYDSEGNFRGDYSEGEAHFRKNKGVRRKTNKYGDETYEALIAGDTIDDKGNSKFYADLTRDPEAAALEEVRKQQADYDKEYKDRYYAGASDKHYDEAEYGSIQDRMGLTGHVISRTDRPQEGLSDIRWVDSEGGEHTSTVKTRFSNVDRKTLQARIARLKELARLNSNALELNSADADRRSYATQAATALNDLATKLHNAEFLNEIRRLGLSRAEVDAMQRSYSDITASRNIMEKLRNVYARRLSEADAQLKAFDNSALAGVGRTVDKNDSRVKALYDKYTAAKNESAKKVRGYGDLYAGQTQADRASKAAAEQRKAQQAIRALYAEKEQLQGQLDNKLQRAWYNLPFTAATQEFLDAGAEMRRDAIDTLSDGAASLYR